MLKRAPRVGPPVVAALAVTVAIALLRLADADLTVAALALLLLVSLAALLGYRAAVVAAVGSYLSLNYWFIPKYGSFTFEKADDFVPLLAFAIAAAASAYTVAHVNTLRRQAIHHEEAAFDAKLDAAVNEGRAGFLAAMTHNLRTPLASIKAAASILRAPAAAVDENGRGRLLETVYDEADRLERLVTKVLELSRVHAGALDPRTEPTDIAELARGAVRRLRHVSSHHDLELVVAGDVVVADVDPEMLELVLVSLLENALRFAPENSQIVVSVRSLDTAGCEIRVIDRGPGVAAADRERIFDEFVRIDPSGSGLGLAISRAFVEAHGGRVWVEATDGGGATFVVAIPAEASRA